MTALDTCPAADDIVLCLSELATNAVRHSASARPGGTFTVHAQIIDGAGVFLEVTDNGGPWQPAEDDGLMHGLGIARSLAASLSIGGGAASGWVVSAWFSWNPADQAAARHQSEHHPRSRRSKTSLPRSVISGQRAAMTTTGMSCPAANCCGTASPALTRN